MGRATQGTNQRTVSMEEGIVDTRIRSMKDRICEVEDNPEARAEFLECLAARWRKAIQAALRDVGWIN